jgi:uncharacterized protein YkwD
VSPLEQRCFELTNLRRTRRWLRPLAADAALTDAARRHSEDMLRRRFFAHVNPDKQTPADRIATAVRQRVMASAENLWMRSGPVSSAFLSHTLDEAIAQLMASSPHRHNIMNATYTHLGVGVAVTVSEIRLTQLFARFG